MVTNTPTMPPIPPTVRDERIRRLAIDRILDFEEELKKRGIRARFGTEVEFFVDNPQGQPIDLPRERLAHIREQLQKSRYVEDLREEYNARSLGQSAAVGSTGPIVGGLGAILTGDISMLAFGSAVGVVGAILFSSGHLVSMKSGRATKATQYEINLGDRLEGTLSPERSDGVPQRPQRHRMGALKAAIATDHIQGEVCRLIEETGRVNYSARPRSDRLTSAMHINMSLGDLQGQNLFIGHNGGESPLMTATIANLIEVQKQGSLLFLPNENSHERIGSGTSAPRNIGRSTNKLVLPPLVESTTAASRNASPGVLARMSRAMNYETRDPRRNRTENRMPGADADPYLAVLATLGAAVKTLRDQEQGLPPQKTRRHRLPRNLGESVQQFRESDLMKELLGAELHTALCEHYRDVPAPVRNR